MPSSAAICPSCQFKSLLSATFPSLQSWQAQRSMAFAMKDRTKPKRMVLSADVGRTQDDSKRSKRVAAGPFAGMNQTEARLPRRMAPPRKPQFTNPRSSRPSTPSTHKAPTTSLPTSTASTTTTPASTTVRKSTKSKDERPLFHALKMQQALAPLSYGKREKLREQLQQIQKFDQLGLMPSVCDAVFTQVLPDLTTYVPTAVQRLAIPTLLSKKGQHEKAKKGAVENKYDQFLIAAETGSGKTLAYLLPVIHHVKEQEDLDRNEEDEKQTQQAQQKEVVRKENIFEANPFEDEVKPDSAMGRPRALILLPSSELVTQVSKVVKAISHTVKYRSAPISAVYSPTVIRNRLFNPKGIDVLIATPHLVSSIAEKDPNILSRIQYLVVDEADSLLDRSFSPITCAIIDRAAPSLKQLILCSATIPNSLDRFLDSRFPQIKRLATPKLHSITRRVQLGVIDIEKEPYRGNRDLACADIIWQLGKAVHEDSSSHHVVKCIMVFVNEREQAEELASFLATKGIDAAALTRDTSEQRQNEILSAFTTASRVEGDEKESAQTKRKPFRDFVPFDDPSAQRSGTGRGSKRLPNTKVLVTTDLGSRGIDTLAVRHVILYDVPHTTIDFIHRLGRCGRMNRRGRGVVLVGKKDRKDVVREVQDAMFRGQALI